MDALTIIGIIGIIIGIVAGIVQIVDYLQKQREQRALATTHKPLSAAATQTDDTPSHLASLRQQLTNLFNEGELRNLCFDLGVDYESLPARGKDGKARELIAHMQRNGRLSELITMGRRLRPQAHWPDLPHEPTPDPFPKQAISHNLPRRSPFVGRDAEKAQVHQALLADGYLVSIEGIGGIGKSSLALQVAHECFQASVDKGEDRDIATFEGLIWVTAKDQELNLDGMLNTVARTLEYVGIAQQPIEEKQVAVQKLLRSKRCLLILDNYQTVTDDGVHRFLRELPEPSKALITTRIQNTPQAHIVSLKGMTQAEALVLIHSDGQRLGLHAVAQADEAVLARLYEATGGAPLALKWALGQIKQKGQSLDIVLTALHEARGTIFEAMFARAWELLSENARRILLVMPIFATSADRPDIEAASNIRDVILDDALGQLVEMTLVDTTNDMGLTSQRYSIHPLTRAFAHAQLTKEPDFNQQSRLRLANYYITQGHIIGDWGSVLGFPWFESELPNILTILQWSYETQHWNVVSALYEPIIYFLEIRGYWSEHIKYGRMTIEAAQKLDNREQVASYQKAIALTFYRQHRYREAQELLESSIQQYINLGNNERVAMAMVTLAKVLVAKNDLSTATQILDEVTNTVEQGGYQTILSGLLTTKGQVAFRQREYAAAHKLFTQALEIIAKENRPASIGSRQIDLGYVALEQDQLDEAARLLGAGLESSHQVQRQDNIAKAQLGLARVHARRGDNTQAIKFARSAKVVFERMLMENEVRETEQLLRELAEAESETREQRSIN